jgi:carbonic anhydrase
MSGKRTNIPAIDRELSSLQVTKRDIKEAVIENIHMQVAKALTKYQARVAQGKLTIIGALYDFKNDYGFGWGKIIVVNVNGHSDPRLFQETYLNKVPYFKFLSTKQPNKQKENGLKHNFTERDASNSDLTLLQAVRP